MKKLFLLLTAIVISAAPVFLNPAVAQGVGPVTAKKGKWELRVSKDGFSDETRCVITYIGRSDIQVSQGSLFFDYSKKGGVESYEYRLDNEPSSGLILPDDVLRRIGIVKISGQGFSRVMTSSRVRVQVLTLIAGLSNEDVSTSGLFELYNQMLDRCGAR